MHQTIITKKELTEKIEAQLDLIRPYLQADQGGVEIAEITESGVLRIRLLGACGNCPMSIMTFKAGIEEAILSKVPEIKAVQAINITDANDPTAIMPNS